MASLSATSSRTRYAAGITATLSAILMLAAANQNLLLAPERLKTLLAWIGERSYALYVIHIPAFFATCELFYRINPGQTLSCDLIIAHLVCALLLSVIAVELNFHLIETRLRKYGTSVSNRPLGSQPPADMYLVPPATSRS